MSYNIKSRGLTTLKDIEFPPYITTLYCYNNQLTSLEGCPPSVTTLYCFYNQLITLEGCPPNVEILDCSFNHLITLEGCHVEMLICSHNQLTSLKGCPLNVKEIYCYYNQLTTLEGCSLNVKMIDCSNNQLTTLEGCSSNVTKIHWYGNPLTDQYRNESLKQIHNINRIKAFRKGISLLNKLFSVLKIQRFWRKWWYDELDSEGMNRFIKKSFTEFYELYK